MGLVVILLVLAFVAAAFGFGGLASSVVSVSRLLFGVFLGFLLVGVIIRIKRGNWWWF